MKIPKELHLTPGPKKNVQHETAMCCAFYQGFLLKFPKLEPYLYHVPNGGKYHYASTGKAFKRMGVKPGIPDYFLSIPRAGFHGLYMEAKIKRGRLTDDQKMKLEQFRGVGYACCIFRSAEQGLDIIDLYNNNSFYPRPDFEYMPTKSDPGNEAAAD